MIYVREHVQLSVPVATAWDWLSNLEWLVTVNVFHQAARFAGEQRLGVGTRLVVDHGFSRGPFVPRLLRVTHWDEGRRIRWTEVDPSARKYLFPHAQQFSLSPIGENLTLLTDELRGTLNLPVLGGLVDKLLERAIVQWAVRRECACIRRQLTDVRIQS